MSPRISPRISMESLWAIRCVWLRYFDVFRKSLFYYAVTTLSEPLLSLLSFGFGVGALVKTLHAGGTVLPYRQFVFAGIVGQTVLFQGFFEAAYGGYIRMYYQKIFHSMGTTPITLSEVLWGELIWDATKGGSAAMAVILIGVLTRDFAPSSLLLAIPLCFIASMMFSGLGLFVAAMSRTIEQISYPQYLFVFPMFLFCGVFYPIETLPHPVQIAACFLPLTAILSLVRTITLGFPMDWWAIPSVVFWWGLFVFIARRKMISRLVK
jgi:lipooligosaccharide transport system permease protein